MFSKSYFFALCIGTFCFFVASSTQKNPGNPPTGSTGAPGEQTCSRSGCHSGGNFTGSVSISGIPDTVLAGKVYDIVLKQTSNATRGGFQMTCIDNANTACGTFVAASGVNIGTGGGKQYPRQSSPKALAGGAASWAFKWTAPATLPNSDIRFYFSTLCGNGNGNESGDNTLVGADTVKFALTSAAPELDITPAITIVPQKNALHITLWKAEQGLVTVHAINGTMQLQTKIVTQDQFIPTNHLPNGIYVATVKTGEQTKTLKFVVNN
jgi:hypothetical protein